MTPEHRDEYLEAYAAWRLASESFEERMRRVVRGEPVDATELALDATSLMRLHIAWLETSLSLTAYEGGLFRSELATAEPGRGR
jgi:hypothetical protein